MKKLPKGYRPASEVIAELLSQYTKEEIAETRAELAKMYPGHFLPKESK